MLLDSKETKKSEIFRCVFFLLFHVHLNSLLEFINPFGFKYLWGIGSISNNFDDQVFFIKKKKRSHFIKDPTGYHYPFFPFGWVSNIYYELAIFKTIWKIQVNENEIQQRLGITEYHWSPCHVDSWPIGVQHLHKNLLEASHSEISLVGVW